MPAGLGERARATLLVPVTVGKQYTASRGGWLALGCNLLASVLYVIAISTVGWGNVRTTTGLTVVTRDIGLWQECHSVYGCSYITLSAATNAVRAAQAFSVLALATMAASLILHCVYLFDNNCLGNPLICLAVFILLPINAVFLLITVCVYGSKWNDPKYLSPQHETKHSYSFALALVAFLLELFAGCFMLFEVLSQAEQVRRGVNYLKNKMSEQKDSAPENASSMHSSLENIPVPDELTFSDISARGTNDTSAPISHSNNRFGLSNVAVKLQQQAFRGYTKDDGFTDVAFGQSIPSFGDKQHDVKLMNPEGVRYSPADVEGNHGHHGQEQRQHGRRLMRLSDRGIVEQVNIPRQNKLAIYQNKAEPNRGSISTMDSVPRTAGPSPLPFHQFGTSEKTHRASNGLKCSDPHVDFAKSSGYMKSTFERENRRHTPRSRATPPTIPLTSENTSFTPKPTYSGQMNNLVSNQEDMARRHWQEFEHNGKVEEKKMAEENFVKQTTMGWSADQSSNGRKRGNYI